MFLLVAPLFMSANDILRGEFYFKLSQRQM